LTNGSCGRYALPHEAMPTRTIRAVFRKGRFEPLEPIDLPDGTEVSIEIHDAEGSPESTGKRTLRTYNLGLKEREVTREDAYDDEIVPSEQLSADERRGGKRQQRQRVTLPKGPGRTLVPLTREHIYFDRLNKVAFGEIWEKIKSLPGFDEMTDEQALELAMEMQREERRAHKQRR
jgi:predicted DNA-binding antitoxin AbrB/MazE fold protein